MQTTDDVYDITIIGGGPTGLFGAFYAGLRNAKTKIIDSLGELGGQLAALYPEKYVYDMPAFPKVTAKDLVKVMVDQALANKPAVCLGERVVGFRKDDNNVFHLTTDKGTEHLTKTVVIAAGAGAFTPKKLGKPEVDRWDGKGLHYLVKGLEQFEGKRLLIVGGGDSAVDWTLALHNRAKSLTLIHRRAEFRAHEDSVAQMKRSKAVIRTPFELKALAGDQCVREAVIYNNATKEEHTLEVDAVLLNLGFSADLGPIKQWGLQVKGGDIIVNSRMETSIPGVYAAGDVAHFDGKLKLIATGVGEAATAVNYAKNYIDPKAKAFPGHSTNLDAAPGSAK